MRDDSKTNFGFQDVDPAEKDRLVRGVFDSVAGRYDLMNDLMSGGIHRLWKSDFLSWLRPRPDMALLDVAGGTGDVAFRYLERLDGRGQVTVCDVSPAMLSVGRDRAIDRGWLTGIDWICGDAQQLPLASASVDAYTIGFGLRNVTDVQAALAEARRVLRPGGRFLCLEFSHVSLPILRDLYDRYSFDVIPWIGQLVTGDRDAYVYLVESIRRFPSQQALSELIRSAGLDQVRHRDLTGGIAAIHSAWRI